MPRILVGTTGHVDHGKTSLVRALTGIDCDRWAEEKARGITIDLGFAHLTDGDFQVGFVDVPGHERFLHNALAGLGGIRVMLLVIAADEGIKPQTREHVSICSLLGIPTAVVALTKADLVTPDMLEVVQLEVDEFLAATPFRGAPLIPVSSATGQGLPDLKRKLFDLAAQLGSTYDVDGVARLPVDRAFHLQGRGVIVTGTLVSGKVRVSDTLEVLPGPHLVRVRSIQVHGHAREDAAVGERTSLQLSGIALEDVRRGAQLGTPSGFAPAAVVCARLTLLDSAPDLGHTPVPVRLHVYSQEVVGRVRAMAPTKLLPGQTGIVQVALRDTATLVRGDRFILRRESPLQTLGGGDVLDPMWKVRRRKVLEPAIAAIQGGINDALILWIDEAGEMGLDAEQLARRTGMRVGALRDLLQPLVSSGAVIELPEAGSDTPARWVSKATYAGVVDRARQLLDTHFKRNPLSTGLSRAEATQRVLPRAAPAVADIYMAWLQRDEVLMADGDLLTPFIRTFDLPDEELRLARTILERFDTAGLNPPAPDELRTTLSVKRETFERLLAFHVDQARLVRFSTGLFMSNQAMQRVRQALEQAGWDRFTVPQFKEHFNLTRKWAIPVLEHLDSTGVTRRVGDSREVVTRSQSAPAAS
jgi:selenocysteine-specific elongation factor